MVQYKVPESPTQYSLTLEDFFGVDFNNPFDLSIKHSPKMFNMIKENGYLKKRYGLKIKKHIADARVHGIWTYDTPNHEMIIAHVGTKLYEISTDFSEMTQVRENMADEDSFGCFFENKLIILDGVRAIIYGLYNNSYSAHYIDEVAHIPTTTIGNNPDRTGGASLDPVNVCTPFRKNRYIADGSSTVYITDAEGTISASSNDTKVWFLDEDTGQWVLQSSDSYVVDSNNKITFNIAPPATSSSYVGDNVIIQFKVTSAYVNHINKCTMCIPFGIAGNNELLMYSGNPDYQNIIWHTTDGHDSGGENDPTYVDSSDFSKVGDAAITGFLRISDGTLAILKNLTDSDCSIYYATGESYNGKYAFSITEGTRSVGNINKWCCLTTPRAPLFLSERGLEAIVIAQGSSMVERYSDNKSYYVNKKLLREDNYSDSKAVCIDDKYYLFVNNKCYICDTAKYNLPNQISTSQYEWYPLENIPCTAVTRWNGQLLIGDEYGNIKMIGNDYIDEITTTISQEVKCYFETPIIDFGDTRTAKTTRQLILNYIATEPTKFNFGYKTIDESVISEEVVESNGTIKDYLNEVPETLVLKEKARKIMFIKLFVESKRKACEFDRMTIVYTKAGKYRGN